jgi:hypothetical protein
MSGEDQEQRPLLAHNDSGSSAADVIFAAAGMKKPIVGEAVGQSTGRLKKNSLSLAHVLAMSVAGVGPTSM